MKTGALRRMRGFTLVELVIVIVIIGVIAAMAIPRLSRGSAGAGDAALRGDLAILRNAINMYSAEHNGVFPRSTAAEVVDQLTKFSNAAGATADAKSSEYRFGPYLVAVPPCPVGSPANPTGILIDTTNSPPAVDTTNGEGWAYNPNTGVIIANTNATDEFGNAYKDF